MKKESEGEMLSQLSCENSVYCENEKDKYKDDPRVYSQAFTIKREKNNQHKTQVFLL